MKKLWSALIAIVFVSVGCLFSGGQVQAAQKGDYWIQDNEYWGHTYGNYASPETTYLTVTSDGKYMRTVAGDDKKVHIEYYDTNFEYLSGTTVDYELNLFGGFYDNGSYYFLVFGQTNREESDSKEVIRVVKYDHNWTRKGSYSLKGANTTVPFDAGRVSMDSDGTYLYVLTCHEMYTSGDGLNHQANLFMRIQISDMALKTWQYRVSNISEGYVSHSFNQYIRVDGSYMYTLNHGDAHPRSAVLGCSEKTSLSFSRIDIKSYRGKIGANFTDANVGGLEVLRNAIITVGNTTAQDGVDTERKVYYSTTSKSRFNSADSYWLTGGDGYSYGNPYLVKVNQDCAYVLAEGTTGKSTQLQVTRIDGNGDKVGTNYCKQLYGEEEIPIFLSDCQPVYDPNTDRIVWVSCGTNLRFCYIENLSGSKNYGEKQVYTGRPMTGVEVDIDKSTIEEGGTAQIQIIPTPADTDSELTVSYSTTSGAVSISETGVVTGLKVQTGSLVPIQVSVRYETAWGWATRSQYVYVKVTHAMGDAISEEPATCTAEGKRVYKCTACGEKVEEVLPKLKHDMDPNATWTEYGLYDEDEHIEYQCKGTKCRNCDNHTNYSAKYYWRPHTYVQQEIITPATATTSAIARYQCSLCGYELEMSEEEAKSKEPEEEDSDWNWSDSNDGDDSNTNPNPNPNPSPSPENPVGGEEFHNSGTPFTDVDGTKFYGIPVRWAYENNVTGGISATQFAPMQECTRAQVVTFLWRAYGRPEPFTTRSPFVDVQNPNAFYYKAVLWAVENGITTGTSATTFSPDDTVTRGQFVTFLYRSKGQPIVYAQNPFEDVSDTMFYYKPVLWAYSNGVTTGINANHFAPNDPCTRGQVVTFIYRALR